jgi:hypothetical protein
MQIPLRSSEGALAFRSGNAYLLGKAMSEHSSGDLIEAARQQMESRSADADFVNRDYPSLLARFDSDAEFDSCGLSQSIFELKRPGGLLPLSPPTTRGKIGAFFIRQQVKTLWWLIRAFRMRDRALEAAYALLRSQHDRQAALERRVADLETRILQLEGKSDVP